MDVGNDDVDRLPRLQDCERTFAAARLVNNPSRRPQFAREILTHEPIVFDDQDSQGCMVVLHPEFRRGARSSVGLGYRAIWQQNGSTSLEGSC
jgi:hypothetical protein